MKKILITGNSGYIGSHLSNLLSKRDDLEIYGLDKNKPIIPMERFSWNDITMPGYIKWQTADIEFDCVIHLASIANDPMAEIDKNLSWEVSALGTLQLMNFCKKN
jgi:nucleoside-diphosphate-sugar epimerase